MLPIVGMGGIGKTSLAKDVYHDSWVNSHFAIIVWYSVVGKLDINNVLHVVCESAESLVHETHSECKSD